jgi:hypothetical protein
VTQVELIDEKTESQKSREPNPQPKTKFSTRWGRRLTKTDRLRNTKGALVQGHVNNTKAFYMFVLYIQTF